jgi:hypothetical protein
MIDGLSPEARALLDAARGGLSPDAAAVRRMRGKLELATGAGAAGAAAGGLGGASGATASGALGAGATASLGIKLAIVAAVAAALGAGAYLWHAAGAAPEASGGAPIVAPAVAIARAPSPAPTWAQASAAAPAAPATASGAPTWAHEPPAAPPARAPHAPTWTHEPAISPGAPTWAHDHPAAAHDHSHSPSAIASRAPAPASDPRAAPSQAPVATLAREVELVDLAMSALRGGDTSTALRAVNVYARETSGHGQLAEDIAAIEIEALCSLHDPAAATKLSAFDARFPHSAQRARLTGQCP